MKILAIIALSLISLKTTAQPPSTPSASSGTKAPGGLPIDSLTHKFTYSEWVKVDGAKADELYGRAVSWFSKRNDSVENVFPIVKGNGKISSKGYTWLTINALSGMKPNPREQTRELLYTVTIQVKDGGYQFTMSDFYFHYFAKSIFSSDKDSTLESIYFVRHSFNEGGNKNPHDSLTQRFFYQVSSTAKHFSASLRRFMEPSTTDGAAKAASPENMDERVAAAGDELIKAGNQYYTGLGMTIGGSLVDVIAIDALRTVPIALPVLGVAGTVLIIVGTVDMIVSYSHIRKAGRILKYGSKTELGFGLTKTGGIGLSLTF